MAAGVLGGVGDKLGGQKLGVARWVVHAPRGQRLADAVGAKVISVT